jgi:membrane protease YdiL (CAAX protease family)
MGFTFAFGICLAPLALRLGSLWPLALFHGLWDFALISNSIVGANGSVLSIL